MRVLESPYPDALPAALNLGPENFEHEAKMALAVKLFELGRLTSGQAARLAGVPRVTFCWSVNGLVSLVWHGIETRSRQNSRMTHREPARSKNHRMDHNLGGLGLNVGKAVAIGLLSTLAYQYCVLDTEAGTVAEVLRGCSG